MSLHFAKEVGANLRMADQKLVDVIPGKGGGKDEVCFVNVENNVANSINHYCCGDYGDKSSQKSSQKKAFKKIISKSYLTKSADGKKYCRSVKSKRTVNYYNNYEEQCALSSSADASNTNGPLIEQYANHTHANASVGQATMPKIALSTVCNDLVTKDAQPLKLSVSFKHPTKCWSLGGSGSVSFGHSVHAELAKSGEDASDPQLTALVLTCLCLLNLMSSFCASLVETTLFMFVSTHFSAKKTSCEVLQLSILPSSPVDGMDSEVGSACGTELSPSPPPGALCRLPSASTVSYIQAVGHLLPVNLCWGLGNQSNTTTYVFFRLIVHHQERVYCVKGCIVVAWYGSVFRWCMFLQVHGRFVVRDIQPVKLLVVPKHPSNFHSLGKSAVNPCGHLVLAELVKSGGDAPIPQWFLNLISSFCASLVETALFVFVSTHLSVKKASDEVLQSSNTNFLPSLSVGAIDSDVRIPAHVTDLSLRAPSSAVSWLPSVSSASCIRVVGQISLPTDLLWALGNQSMNTSSVFFRLVMNRQERVYYVKGCIMFAWYSSGFCCFVFVQVWCYCTSLLQTNTSSEVVASSRMAVYSAVLTIGCMFLAAEQARPSLTTVTLKSTLLAALCVWVELKQSLKHQYVVRHLPLLIMPSNPSRLELSGEQYIPINSIRNDLNIVITYKLIKPNYVPAGVHSDGSLLPPCCPVSAVSCGLQACPQITENIGDSMIAKSLIPPPVHSEALCEPVHQNVPHYRCSFLCRLLVHGCRLSIVVTATVFPSPPAGIVLRVSLVEWSYPDQEQGSAAFQPHPKLISSVIKMIDVATGGQRCFNLAGQPSPTFLKEEFQLLDVVFGMQLNREQVRLVCVFGSSFEVGGEFLVTSVTHNRSLTIASKQALTSSAVTDLLSPLGKTASATHHSHTVGLTLATVQDTCCNLDVADKASSATVGSRALTSLAVPDLPSPLGKDAFATHSHTLGLTLAAVQDMSCNLDRASSTTVGSHALTSSAVPDLPSSLGKDASTTHHSHSVVLTPAAMENTCYKFDIVDRSILSTVGKHGLASSAVPDLPSPLDSHTIGLLPVATQDWSGKLNITDRVSSVTVESNTFVSCALRDHIALHDHVTIREQVAIREHVAMHDYVAMPKVEASYRAASTWTDTSTIVIVQESGTCKLKMAGRHVKSMCQLHQYGFTSGTPCSPPTITQVKVLSIVMYMCDTQVVIVHCALKITAKAILLQKHAISSSTFHSLTKNESAQPDTPIVYLCTAAMKEDVSHQLRVIEELTKAADTSYECAVILYITLHNYAAVETVSSAEYGCTPVVKHFLVAAVLGKEMGKFMSAVEVPKLENSTLLGDDALISHILHVCATIPRETASFTVSPDSWVVKVLKSVNLLLQVQPFTSHCPSPLTKMQKKVVSSTILDTPMVNFFAEAVQEGVVEQLMLAGKMADVFQQQALASYSWHGLTTLPEPMASSTPPKTATVNISTLALHESMTDQLRIVDKTPIPAELVQQHALTLSAVLGPSSTQSKPASSMAVRVIGISKRSAVVPEDLMSTVSPIMQRNCATGCHSLQAALYEVIKWPLCMQMPRKKKNISDGSPVYNWNELSATSQWQLLPDLSHKPGQTKACKSPAQPTVKSHCNLSVPHAIKVVGQTAVVDTRNTTVRNGISESHPYVRLPVQQRVKKKEEEEEESKRCPGNAIGKVAKCRQPKIVEYHGQAHERAIQQVPRTSDSFHASNHDHHKPALQEALTPRDTWQSCNSGVGVALKAVLEQSESHCSSGHSPGFLILLLLFYLLTPAAASSGSSNPGVSLFDSVLLLLSYLLKPHVMCVVMVTIVLILIVFFVLFCRQSTSEPNNDGPIDHITQPHHHGDAYPIDHVTQPHHHGDACPNEHIAHPHEEEGDHPRLESAISFATPCGVIVNQPIPTPCSNVYHTPVQEDSSDIVNLGDLILSSSGFLFCNGSHPQMQPPGVISSSSAAPDLDQVDKHTTSEVSAKAYRSRVYVGTDEEYQQKLAASQNHGNSLCFAVPFSKQHSVSESSIAPCGNSSAVLFCSEKPSLDVSSNVSPFCDQLSGTSLDSNVAVTGLVDDVSHYDPSTSALVGLPSTTYHREGLRQLDPPSRNETAANGMVGCGQAVGDSQCVKDIDVNVHCGDLDALNCNVEGDFNGPLELDGVDALHGMQANEDEAQEPSAWDYEDEPQGSIYEEFYKHFLNSFGDSTT